MQTKAVSVNAAFANSFYLWNDSADFYHHGGTMRQSVLVLLSFLLVASPAYSKGFKILTPSQIQKVIGDYPVNGSAEETKDFDTLLNFQPKRTEAECAEARAEESASLATFFAGKKGPLSAAEGKKWSLKIMATYAELGINVTVAKRMYKRPRPYNYNSQIVPCISLEGSYAFQVATR